MIATVLLARHAVHADVGRVLSGRGGGALTPHGRDQAHALADRLAIRRATRRIVAIHASPQVRTRETAGIVADRIGIAVETVAALDEIDFGAWTGRPFHLLAADPAWTEWNTRRAGARAPGGETMAEATARALDHVRAAAAGLADDDDDDDDGVLLCVTHCDIVRGVIAHLLGLSADNILRFDVDPASISTVRIADWGDRVLSVNEGPP